MPLLSTAVSFQAQITGSPVNRAYPWVQMVDSEDGEMVIPPNPRSGTYTKNPAYEANQNTTIPIGKIVTLWPGYNDIAGVGMDYRFDHPCLYSASASGSGSGSGSRSQSTSGSLSGSASGSSSASGSQSSSASSSSTHSIITTSGCHLCLNGAAKQFVIPISGVTNKNCTQCNNYNGNHIVTWFTGCQWIDGNNTFACYRDGLGNNDAIEWNLIITNLGTTWTVEVLVQTSLLVSPYTENDVIWSTTITAGSWDCKSPITLFLTTGATDGSNDCTNWPSSITVNPV